MERKAIGSGLRDTNDGSTRLWLATVEQALRDYRGEATRLEQRKAAEFLFPEDAEGKDNLNFVFYLADLNADFIVSKLNQREAA